MNSELSFEVFKWATAAVSIAGVVLNIRHDRRCFYLWAGTNAAWTAIDAAYGIWSQAVLQAIYFTLAIWGIMSWKRS